MIPSVLDPPNLASCSPGVGNGMAMVKKAGEQLLYIITVEDEVPRAKLPSSARRVGTDTG